MFWLIWRNACKVSWLPTLLMSHRAKVQCSEIIDAKVRWYQLFRCTLRSPMQKSLWDIKLCKSTRNSAVQNALWDQLCDSDLRSAIQKYSEINYTKVLRDQLGKDTLKRARNMSTFKCDNNIGILRMSEWKDRSATVLLDGLVIYTKMIWDGVRQKQKGWGSLKITYLFWTKDYLPI